MTQSFSKILKETLAGHVKRCDAQPHSKNTKTVPGAFFLLSNKKKMKTSNIWEKAIHQTLLNMHTITSETK